MIETVIWKRLITNKDIITPYERNVIVKLMSYFDSWTENIALSAKTCHDIGYFMRGSLPKGDCNKASYWRNLPRGLYSYIPSEEVDLKVENALSNHGVIEVLRFDPQVTVVNWYEQPLAAVHHCGANHLIENVTWKRSLLHDEASELYSPLDYTNKKIFTASGNWVIPKTGWYKFTIVGGGGGGVGNSPPAFNATQNGEISTLYSPNSSNPNNILIAAYGGFSGNHPKNPGVGGQCHNGYDSSPCWGYRVNGTLYGDGGSTTSNSGGNGYGGSGFMEEKVLKMNANQQIAFIVGAAGQNAGTGVLSSAGNGVLMVEWN